MDFTGKSSKGRGIMSGSPEEGSETTPRIKIEGLVGSNRDSKMAHVRGRFGG